MTNIRYNKNMIKPITLQEAFNIIYQKAQQQNSVSTAPNETDEPNFLCAYKNLDGKECFVGMLIPEELYDAKMDYENDDAKQLLENYPSLREYFSLIGQQTLLELQDIHDSAGTMLNPWENRWKEILHTFAEDYSLTIPSNTDARELVTR